MDQGLFHFHEPYLLVGVDEVGVACLAGPVVAACFVRYVDPSQPWPQNPSELLVADSKVLSTQQRQKSIRILEESDLGSAQIGQASVEEIDSLNILHASGLAQVRAVQSYLNAHPGHSGLPLGIVVDGNRVSRFWSDLRHEADVQLRAVVKADGKHFVVAAASLFAKEFRDSLMTELNEKHPGYGWDSNVGYPTPSHKMALKSLGPSPLHRHSFAPVREAAETSAQVQSR